MLFEAVPCKKKVVEVVPAKRGRVLQRRKNSGEGLLTSNDASRCSGTAWDPRRAVIPWWD